MAGRSINGVPSSAPAGAPRHLYVRLSPPLQVERRDDGRRVLSRPFVAEVDGLRIEAPAGFDTDYSSIPQPVACLVRWSAVDVAGLLHDVAYRRGDPPRVVADRIWRIVAMVGPGGARPWQAWLGWLGLRVGGWVAWRQRARERRERQP